MAEVHSLAPTLFQTPVHGMRRLLDPSTIGCSLKMTPAGNLPEVIDVIGIGPCSTAEIRQHRQSSVLPVHRAFVSNGQTGINKREANASSGIVDCESDGAICGAVETAHP